MDYVIQTIILKPPQRDSYPQLYFTWLLEFSDDNATIELQKDESFPGFYDNTSYRWMEPGSAENIEYPTWSDDIKITSVQGEADVSHYICFYDDDTLRKADTTCEFKISHEELQREYDKIESEQGIGEYNYNENIDTGFDNIFLYSKNDEGGVGYTLEIVVDAVPAEQ